jgi:glycosyltransferase involved in cell wall biosynthesis
MLGNGHKRTIPISLRTHLPYTDALIVHNGSDDGSLGVVQDIMKDRPFTVIQEYGPPDFAVFKNDAMEKASTPWLLFICADEYFWCTIQPVVFRQMLFASQNYAFKVPRFNYPFAPDFPDYQTDIVRKSGGHYIHKLHEMWEGSPALVLPHTIKIHMPSSRAFLAWRDQRFLTIDAERQAAHMGRPVIQERVKDEYAYAPEGD